MDFILIFVSTIVSMYILMKIDIKNKITALLNSYKIQLDLFSNQSDDKDFQNKVFSNTRTQLIILLNLFLSILFIVSPFIVLFLFGIDLNTLVGTYGIITSILAVIFYLVILKKIR